MGYTHYFSRKKSIPLAVFKAAAEDCRKVVEFIQAEHKFPLQYAYDEWEGNPPDGLAPAVFSKDEVHFNGVGDDAHETFGIERVHVKPYESQEPDEKAMWFGFCKTARKPYDPAVCACLIVFKHHLGDKFTVGSDGDDDEEGWPIARAACQKVLGYGETFSLNTPERLGKKGLGLSRRTTRYPAQGFQYRTFDNGWEVRKPCERWGYHGWGPHTYKVVSRGGGAGDKLICSAHTLARVRWLATILYVAELMKETADNPFVKAARDSQGDWLPLYVLADHYDDAQDPRGTALRALLPCLPTAV